MPGKIVGYYGSCSFYRRGNGKYRIDNIDPDKFTHLIYSYVGFKKDGTIKIIDNWKDVQNDGFKKFVALRKKNPNLKLMVCIGGFYNFVTKDEESRELFATNIVDFLQEYNFDGLDFDWEYPMRTRGENPEKANFLEFLKVLRDKFKENGNNYLVSAVVGASKSSLNNFNKVYKMAQYLDFINLSEYDFHGCWDGFTGHNAPLSSSSSTDDLNIKSSLEAWMNAGAPAHKLILGLSTFGHCYYLCDPKEHEVAANILGPGEQGKYTQQPGMLGYNEICELQKERGWTLVWDVFQRVPYMYKDYHWISYDNVRSIKEKVQYAKWLHLGGVMISNIETDDFLGVSGQINPIISAVRASF